MHDQRARRALRRRRQWYAGLATPSPAAHRGERPVRERDRDEEQAVLERQRAVAVADRDRHEQRGVAADHHARDADDRAGDVEQRRRARTLVVAVDVPHPAPAKASAARKYSPMVILRPCTAPTPPSRDGPRCASSAGWPIPSSASG